MRKLMFALLLSFTAASMLLSCNEKVDVKRAVTDKPGVVFLEGGHYDTVPTNITSEQLRAALIEKTWEYSYSFFYDDYEIGYRNEAILESRFSYDFRADGTVTATDLSDGKTYDYNYDINARTVTLLSNRTAPFSFAVIAMDASHMVCDESLKGEYVHEYDPESLMRRYVFKSKRK